MEFLGKVIYNKENVTEAWKVLYKEELHNVYCLRIIMFGEIKMNKVGGPCGTYSGVQE